MLRQGGGVPRRCGLRGLAGLFGRVDVVGRALALDGPDAASALGLLWLRRRRRIDDRRQRMVARHGFAPLAGPHLAADSVSAATDKSVMWLGPAASVLKMDCRVV